MLIYCICSDEFKHLFAGQSFIVDRPNELEIVLWIVIHKSKIASRSHEVLDLKQRIVHHVEVHIHKIVKILGGVRLEGKDHIVLVGFDQIVTIKGPILHFFDSILHLVLVAPTLQHLLQHIRLALVRHHIILEDNRKGIVDCRAVHVEVLQARRVPELEEGGVAVLVLREREDGEVADLLTGSQGEARSVGAPAREPVDAGREAGELAAANAHSHGSYHTEIIIYFRWQKERDSLI